MTIQRMATIDGNEAAASVAYRLNELAALYPITPSSPMGELADDWFARRCRYIRGNMVSVLEMQSEGGVVVLVLILCNCPGVC